ncbi:hypothetical protein AN191_16715 [Loktanella sp. 5RATIMAR09]|uniref:FAD:protein FMN transferase n=1 Tax=Loktanella sp. 5RATIMAR09 TaxID=1225655 RepID=UPI0006EB6B25|nr:FAD:protein FMN transferase [Loktanella sp. 5RATIMAR09]KQI70703.1 hypothetical protein AN191_16715 [Loktanella sp. 5RATIMAR09]
MTAIGRRDFALGLAALPAALGVPALAHAGTETGGTAFGTYWRLLVSDRRQALRAQAVAEAVFADVTAAMSPWDDSSELSRFNAASADRPFVPGTSLTHVAEAALSLARLTDGAFDPTVGPLVARYGFGPVAGDGPPDWRGVTLEGGALRKARSGLTLDLCGIAKGHALDRLAESLRHEGVVDAFLDLGGEMRGLGRHPAGRNWRSAVARPFAADGAALAVIEPGGLAVATSGVAEQSYVLAGRRISHLIDPVAAAPVGDGLLSVTVLAPTAMAADGLATALAAMGPLRGPAWARGRGIPAFFAIGEPGAVTTRQTGPFAAHRIG